MREIKFRAWDKENNRFFEPTYEAYRGKLEELVITLSGRLSLREADYFKDESLFSDRFVLMQYTGLKDRNGKEVFEGDVVRVSPDEGKTWDIGKVVFGKYACFNVHIQNLTISSPLVNFCSSTMGVGFDKTSVYIEVIGNAYQNPELLPQAIKI